MQLRNYFQSLLDKGPELEEDKENVQVSQLLLVETHLSNIQILAHIDYSNQDNKLLLFVKMFLTLLPYPL